MSQELQDRVAKAQSEETRKRFSAGLAWLVEQIQHQVLSGERRVVHERLVEAQYWWGEYCKKNPPHVPLGGAAGTEKVSPSQSQG